MSRALLVDLYELTMAASYHAEGMNGASTFELFIRELPPVRNYLVACGLEEALAYLAGLRFTKGDLAYLQTLDLFQPSFLDYLGDLRFTGDVWAVPEGEVVFATEPVLRVVGPLIEAQIVETFLLNCINFSTAVASKAARVATVCDGRSFVDFSARRDHGADAALLAARAAYLGGAAATSNVLAGQSFGIPLSGTMGHSYVLAFPDEAAAFRAFARRFPAGAVLLIDTFDTVRGARTAAAVAGELAAEGVVVRGVRIDSGDLAALAVAVRAILDEAGLPGLEIFASGDLDEYRIAALLDSGAPIDGFGVGTQLGTSGDAPALGGVYKLVEDLSGPKSKTSTGKATLPAVKQVYRLDEGGPGARDLIAPATAPAPPGGRPLLAPVMQRGRRLGPPPALADGRARCRAALSALPSRVRSLEPARPGYEVEVAAELKVRRPDPPV
ncbi:MAG: nicotinate phosphoribosyltransferase [Actinomycetota bacterium]|nr:nicotinate phosphoribosyltransferase [Actinomycetota bacterium]